MAASASAAHAAHKEHGAVVEAIARCDETAATRTRAMLAHLAAQRRAYRRDRPDRRR